MMRISRTLRVALAAGLVMSTAPSAFGTTLTLPNVAARSIQDRDQLIEDAVRRFTANLSTLTAKERFNMARTGRPVPLVTMPVRVVLPGVAPRPTRRGATDITLAFEASGSRAFSPEYQALLQAVFNSAKSRLNLVFGLPAEGGTVWVRNYDADMGDRDAVSGGIYLDNNGSGQREIRFPVYADGIGIKPEVAAVNFVHTLLLAYQGSKPLPWDGWDDGLARAATIRVCRTPNALPPSLDSESVEGVLDGTYDLGGLYDWNNQRALSGPVFIAPNLRDAQLPLGGSVGGLYLLRYLMAGSAWQKVLVEYPAFAATFMASYYANSASYQSVSQLAALGQSTLGTLGGTTIEGLPFAEWVRKQYILDPSFSPGLKLQVQPFPIVSGLSGTDFGVFAIQAHFFETLPNGNESLLRGTSYPIYWSPDFTRFFASAQDDRIDIIQAYGNVVPNFPSTPAAGQPYRVTVDVPVEDQLERLSLPAGAIATASNPTPSDIYGTITGIGAATNQTLSVEVQYGSTFQTIPVQNFAFGAVISDTAFEGSLPLTVRVKRTVSGITTTLYTRRVNKGPGPIALVLNVDARTSFDLSLNGGIQTIGTPIESETNRLDTALGSTENQTQASRWNPLLARFDFFPNSGALRQGHGYFVRRDAPSTVTVLGTQPAFQPISVALRQGWNLICNPLNRNVNRSDLRFVTETGFPQTFAEAVGPVVGPDIFKFVPGAADAVTGFPETGNFTSVTGLNAGDAFYIKVLSPTGTTLVFGDGTTALGRLPGTNPVEPNAQWGMHLELWSSVDRADAYIGQAQGATNAFDRAHDIESPPGNSGLGLKVGSNLYRETRAYGSTGSWSIQLSNLKLGREYTIRLVPDSTRMTRYRFRDPVRRFLRDWRGTQSYSFIANARTRTMTLETARPQ